MMTWPEILNDVRLAMELPTEHSDPWRQDRVRPSDDVVSMWVAATLACEQETRRRPDRVVVSADETLVGYYFGPDGYRLIEVYPAEEDDDPNDGRIVVGWVPNDRESEPHIIGIHLEDAMSGAAFGIIDQAGETNG